MTGQRNINKAFRDSTLALPEGTPWEKNWDKSTQPTLATIQEYRDMGRNLRGQMLKDAEKLLLIAPGARLKDDTGREYHVSDIPQLIRDLDANPDDNRFLKASESAERKLLDNNVNQHPEKIKDYLRFQILVSTPVEAALLRNALLTGISGITVSAHKDQFRRPCEEGGHRAFKTHNIVSDGTNSMLAESQISIDALERSSETKLCRHVERMMRASSGELGVSFKKAAAYSEIAERFQAFRKLRNWELAQDFDCMLDQDINATEIKQEAELIFSTGSDTSNKIMSHFRFNPASLLQSGDTSRTPAFH